MRRLMWFTVGFAIACLICTSWLWEAPLVPIFLSGALLTALTFGLSVPYSPFRIPAAILLGFGSGIGWILLLQTCYYEPLLPYDGKTIPLSITADTFSEQALYSMTFDGRTEINGKTYSVRVYLSDDRVVSPGDKLESAYRLRLTVPSGLKESAYYQGQGIYLIATQKGEMQQTAAEKKTWRTWSAYMAEGMKKIIHRCFSEDDAAFAQALLLGDSSELPYEMDTALKVSGIRHIVAVSGLHVTILLGLLLAVFRSTGILLPILTAVILAGFAAITGFTPSVIRACIMGGLGVLSFSLRKEYDSPTGLSLACLLMLLWNPFLVLSVSFQLSISCVAGIVAFYQSLNLWIGQKLAVRKPNFIVKWCISSAAVSFSSMAFSLPFSACYFETVSLIGPITNLLCIWMVSIIFCGIGLVCAIDGFNPAFASILAKPVSWLIHLVLWIAKKLSVFPLAAVYTCSPWIAAWLVFCGILFVLFLLLRRKYPARYLSAAAVTLLIAVSLSWILPRMDDTRLTVLSVGEGQSILLQSKGKTFLVDCGGGNNASAANAAAQMLISQGIFHIDGAALTHYDIDHSGGLLYFLSRITVDTLYLPDMEDKGFLGKIGDTYDVQLIQEDTMISLGTGEITLFQPGNLKTTNENCMCILFDTQNCDILITGDRGKSGEKRWIKEHPEIDVDVLIAGHHGSKNSTTSELLETVTPEIVVISTGKNNSYGHPAPEMLERLEEHNCLVLRTDLDGTVIIRR